MLAIKAALNNGKITFIDALPENVKNARLTIVIEPESENEKPGIPGQKFQPTATSSEEEFRLIGMNSFFDDEDDNKINWEDYFGIK